MAARKQDQPEYLWVLSNRRDNRVVLHERDRRHPGGEAFVGGSVPAKVFRSNEVARLLREGYLIEIPEPPDGRKKPKVKPVPDPLAAAPVAAAPGAATPLGRQLDPELVPEEAQASIREQQEEAGDEVPAPDGAVVPPPVEPQRERRRG